MTQFEAKEGESLDKHQWAAIDQLGQQGYSRGSRHARLRSADVGRRYAF